VSVSFSSDRRSFAPMTIYNKCIGDDMKAAVRQSPDCIFKKQKNKIWRKTIFNTADGIIIPCNVARSWHWFRQVTAPCNVSCGSGIMTVNSPSGSTLQCDTWLWDALGWHAMEFAQTSTILEFYIWCRFWPHHRSRPVILHQSKKFYQNRTTLGRKKWRHVNFQDDGSQPSWILGVQ